MSSKRFTTDYRWRVPQAVARSRDARGAIELGLAGLLIPLGGFVTNVVFAHMLGASGLGNLAAIVAALAVSEAVLAFGLPDVLSRHVAKGSLPAGASGTLALEAVAAASIPGLLVCLYCHSRHFSWPVAAAAGLAVPVLTATTLARGVLVGRQAYRTISVALIFRGVVRLVAPTALLLVENPSENFALILVVASTVAPALPIFASRPFAGPLAPARAAWPILRESLGVWPLYLAWSLNARLDQLVLAVAVPPADLGRYAVSVNIAEVPASAAQGPREVILARVAKSRTFPGVRAITLAILAIGVAVGGLAALFAGPLLAVVFGPEFRSASLVLGILLAATGFDTGAGVLTRCLIALGHGRSATMCYVLGLCVTVVVLPPALLLGGGILAAAAVSLTAAVCAYLVALASLRRLSQAEGASP
jgi:O-antigen/teichoic acid export membrane protein